MSFWENPVVPTLLALVVFLALAEGLRAVLPPLRSLGIPASIVAGVLGLIAGPNLLNLAPLDGEVLEGLVYHGLAIVFIAVSLQAPRDGGAGPGARSMAFGITAMVAMQTALGLTLVLGLGLIAGSHLHPGFGLLLPLGFEQGPGQALSLGKAWESSGMPDGAQVGLIIAALGFAWSVGAGIPLVVYGRARGWVGEGRTAAAGTAEVAVEDGLAPGSLEKLSHQLVAIGAVYALTWAACLGLSRALASVPDIATMIWGFHFMVGALIAMGVRPLLARLPAGTPLDDRLLGRIAGTTVDGLTVAALSAVQLTVFGAHLLPILVVTTAGGLVTLLVAVALARRAFPEAWFEHCVLWFGMSTGTMPMGLALLRIIDPELQSPAPVSAVLGSAGAIVGVAPIVLLIHPIPIAGWAEGYPTAGFVALGASLLYLAVTMGLWWATSMRAQGQPGSPATS